MEERDNILRILNGTRKAIETNNYAEIKNLSDQTINTASLTQDPDNVLVAVIVYSLSKILERPKYKQFPGWRDFYKIVTKSLNSSINDLEKNDEKKFRQDFELIRRVIGKLSGKLKDYVQDVFRKAQVNKASKIYEHGISMEQTADLLGITMYELANYAGQTDIAEAPENKTLSQKERIKIAEEMFK